MLISDYLTPLKKPLNRSIAAAAAAAAVVVVEVVVLVVVVVVLYKLVMRTIECTRQ